MVDGFCEIKVTASEHRAVSALSPEFAKSEVVQAGGVRRPSQIMFTCSLASNSRMELSTSGMELSMFSTQPQIDMLLLTTLAALLGNSLVSGHVFVIYTLSSTVICCELIRCAGTFARGYQFGFSRRCLNMHVSGPWLDLQDSWPQLMVQS